MRLVRQGIWLLLVLLLAGAAAGAAAAYLAAPTYQVRTTIYMNITGTENATDLQAANVYVMQKSPTWAILATSDPVLREATQRLSDGTTLAEMQESTSASARESSGIIDIFGSGRIPMQVAERTNAAAAALLSAISASSEQPRSATVTATIIAPALVPTVAIAPQPRYNIFAGALIGLVLAIVVTLTRHALDTRVYSLRDIPADPSFVVRTAVPAARSRRLSQADSARLEAFRGLRVRLQFGTDHVRSIAIAPAGPESNSAEVARELCMVFAEVGTSVVLINADLHPVVAVRSRDDAPVSREGVAQVLTHEAGPQAVVDTIESKTGLVHAIAPGRVDEHSAQLLSTNALADLLIELEPKYSLVVLACPPLSERAEATAVSAVAAMTLVLAKGGVTRRESLRSALSRLSGVRAKSVGILLEQSQKA